MRNRVVKPESSRSCRRRLSRTKARRLALATAIPATVLAVSLNPLLANAASSQSYFVVLGRHDRVGDGDRVRANSVASSAKKFVPMLFTKKAPKKGADSPNAGSTQPKPAAGDGDTKDSGTSN